jgi:histidyl-tRNA synthetase
LAEKVRFQAIKGVRDILPPESALWNRVEQTAREVFIPYGFGEIRLPNFELARLFEHSVGDETDIVTKELYTWIDSPLANRALRKVRAKEIENANRAIHDNQTPRGELFRQAEEGAFDTLNKANLVCLRPEATASVCRAYIEHEMHTLPGNVKLYYMGPMFRRERPQKGRHRQFYQIGAEVLGSSDAPGIDAEVIEMLMKLFERLKLKSAVLNINSIGDKNCRPAYVEKLRAELQKVRDQLGADSQRRIETNPLRVLDSKLESEQAIIEKLPRIVEHLCDNCREHYAEVKRQLGLRGIAFQENWRLVRGLDYYMRTTFEITAPGLGSQNAVCGGGRYDGLVELLGGPAATKGIGFAIGTDRLVLSLQEAGEGAAPGGPAGKAGGPARPAGGPDVYLAWFGAAAQSAAIGLARRLRDAGFVVELPAVEMKFGKSLGLADRLKARHAVILGDDELAAGIVTVKRLTDGTQQKLSEQELLSYLHAI